MLATKKRQLNEQNKQICNTSEQINRVLLISEPLKKKELSKVTEKPTATKKTAYEKLPKPSLRFDGKTHLPKFDCDERKGYRCKLEDCSKQTSVYCETCDVHLCFVPGKNGKGRNCFRKFHILNEN